MTMTASLTSGTATHMQFFLEKGHRSIAFLGTFTSQDEEHLASFKHQYYRANYFPNGRGLSLYSRIGVRPANLLLEQLSSKLSQLTTKFIKGNTLFIREVHAYPETNYFTTQYGHIGQITYKLAEVRRLNPGVKIDFMFFVHGYNEDIPETMCDSLRVAMSEEGENFELPQFLFGDDPAMEGVTFERILFSDYSKDYFASIEGASRWRSDALRMCNVVERQCNCMGTVKPKNIFFVSRGDSRNIATLDEMCSYAESQGYNAYAVNPGALSFCEQVELWHYSDIFVSPFGSANVNLAFARPGSVMIEVYSPRYRVQANKLIAYYSQVRYLEYMSTDEEANKEYLPSAPWHVPVEECEVDWLCLVQFATGTPIFPVEHFAKWLKFAVTDRFNQNELDSCEYPVKWPRQPTNLNYALWLGAEYNSLMCEPPLDCVCCRHKYCNRYLHL